MKRYFIVLLLIICALAFSGCRDLPPIDEPPVDKPPEVVTPGGDTPTDKPNEKPEVVYHEVVFKGYDGSVLYSATVKNGDDAKYQGDVPTRDGGDDCIYTFAGWDKPLSSIHSDTVFTATFNATPLYSVVWENYDGSILYSTTVKSGDDAKYQGDVPTRDGGDECIYTFVGWDKPLSSILSDTVFTAKFDVTPLYTILWTNYDGELLEEDRRVRSGEVPTFDGEIPTREEDIEYSYRFVGWTPTVSEATASVTYTAKYDAIKRTYTVVFENYDGRIVLKMDNLPYGTPIVYDGETPTRVSDEANYLYNFRGWVGDTTVTGDTTLIAEYDRIHYYDIEYLGAGDEILYSTILIDGEELPDYVGELPTRPKADGLQYEFSTWVETERTEHLIRFTASFNSCTEGLVFSEGKLTKYRGEHAEVIIPDSWGGYDITVIGADVFYDNDYITTVKIGKNVKEIGLDAFSNATFLESVDFPDGLEVIGDSAFYHCYSLKSITLPRSVHTLEEDAFGNCLSLDSVVLNEGLVNIGPYAFYNCYYITEIIIPDSVATIGERAFARCKGLTEILIPESVVTIGLSAFQACNNMTIYCAVTEKPAGWDENWNSSGRPVVWKED